MRVHDSGLCFVGAHLSSGESEGDDLKRNFDYAEIVRRAAFPSDSMSVDPEALGPGNPNGQAGVSKVGRLFVLDRPFGYTEIVRRGAFLSDSMSVNPEALGPGNPNGQAGVSKVVRRFCDGWAHHLGVSCPYFVRYDCCCVSLSSKALVLHQVHSFRVSL
jgi:hypothetical protein